MQNISWWDRLGFRLTAAIVLITLATMTLFAALVIRTQQAHVRAELVESVALLSDTIKGSVYHAMLADHRADAYRSMETMARQPQIEHVRMFNKEGRITFSTRAGETNTFVDKRAESCYACHAADQPIVRLNLPSRSRTYWHDGHRVLGMVTPIYNEPSCSSAACHAHPASQRVLGVVDMGLSLEQADRDLATLQWATVIITVLSVGLLGGVVMLLQRRWVVRPIAQLVHATRRVAGGDLRSQLRVERRDELGVLQTSFNDMAQALARGRSERLHLLDSLERKVEERTAALRQAQDQMVRSEKLSSLGRLAASVAHEINNPLAGILTYAKLLIRTIEEGTSTDAQRAAAVRQLKLVQRETERCTAIVRNLLDFARERPLTLTDASVSSAIDEGLALVANQARLQNITIERDYHAVSPVHADFGQLRQAFINVIINACDAMPGGGTLRIGVAPGQEPGTVAITFTDTGTGISPEHLSKILDPFFTTKEKGTGLGLSVVYGIVERHGGRLDIDSAVGRGTTVRIVLPAAHAPSTSGTTGPAASNEAATAASPIPAPGAGTSASMVAPGAARTGSA